MQKDPTKEEIAAWLEDLGHDRAWLGEQCASSKATVDGWFSTRGFPKPALQTIRRLMDSVPAPAAEISQITFTLSEFEEIDMARLKAGYGNRKDFYRDAIIEATRKIARATGSKPTADPLRSLPLAAEDGAPYTHQLKDQSE